MVQPAPVPVMYTIGHSTRSLDEFVGLLRANGIGQVCAEAVPWRCHRSLIADALLARGIRVEEIIGMQLPKAHRPTRWAKVDGTTVTYPPDAAAMATDTNEASERGSGDRGPDEHGSGER